MLKVSDDFKEHIKAQNRELTGYVKINYDRLNDMQIVPSIDNNNEELMCDDFCVCGERGRAINYASLERDFFKLDGSFILPSNPNINNYKWLKITNNRSFTIPYVPEEGQFGISVAFEFNVNSYNTNLLKINGKNGGQAKIYINNDGYIVVSGTWCGIQIESPITENFLMKVELNKNYKILFNQTAPQSNNAYVTFDIALLNFNTSNLGTVIFDGDLEQVDSIEFSQDNNSIENISSVKIPKFSNMYGYLGSILLIKYLSQQYLGDLKYHYEFTNNSLEVKDLIERHIGTISSIPELVDKLYQNDNTGFISNTLNTSEIEINYYNKKYFDNKNLTLYFMHGYPLSLELTLYYKEDYDSENINTYTKIVTDINNEILHIDCSDIPGLYITKINIKIDSWSNPNYRVRLEKIDLGYTEIYESDLISFKILEEISKFNEAAPDYSCEVTINNYDRKFDFINDKGLFQKLNKYVTAEPYIGLKGNTLKYVPMGFFNFSDLSNSSDLTTTIKFEGAKALGKTESSVRYGYSNQGNISELIESNPLVNWEIAEESIGNHVGYNFDTTSDYKSTKTALEELQELSFASCSLCLQSRYAPVADFGWGITYVKPISLNVADNITLNEQTEYPTVTKKSKINQAISTINTVFNLSSDYKEIYNQTMQKTSESYLYNGETEHIVYDFDFDFETTSPIDFENLQIYVDNSLVNSQTAYFTAYTSGSYYIHGVQITATGEDSSGNFDESKLKEEINVRIMAKQYEKQDSSITINKNNELPDTETVGMEFSNNYLRTTENQQHVANYIFNNDYPYHASLQTIGDPSLLPGDLVDFETPFGFKRMMIEKQTITYNGGLSASIEGDAYDIEDV